MEVMEFALGLYTGIVVGFVLRGLVHKLDFKVKDFGMTHGSKTKNH